MTHILLDPAIAIPPGVLPTADMARFWQRFIEWQVDARTHLGRRSLDALTTFYSNTISANPAYIPAGLQRSVHKSILKLIERGALDHSVADCGVGLSSTYQAPGFHSTLVDDVVGATAMAYCDIALGSAEEYWSSPPDFVGCVPPPPHSIPVHYSPGLPTKAELANARHAHFRSWRMLVFGGQRDDGVIKAVSEDYGIATKDIRWTACERHKPPRDIDKAISGMGQKDDVVICVTGKVSHATSIKLSAVCKSRGVRLETLESASGICARLERMMTEGS